MGVHSNLMVKHSTTYVLVTYIYVTGFTKTVPIGTRNEIQFIGDY